MLNEQFIKSVLLLFVLLNPPLMTVYLIDLIRGLDRATFNRVLLRGGAISAAVFAAFALTGDAIFTDLLQVRFAAFLLFGGLIFLLIGVRFVMVGPDAIHQLRGQPEHLAGSVAMPFMIGPGTVSASILIGAQLKSPALSIAAILVALASTLLGVIVLKQLHDWVRQRNAELVERYVDVVGRISALVIGTIAVEMILQGIDLWRASAETEALEALQALTR